MQQQAVLAAVKEKASEETADDFEIKNTTSETDFSTAKDVEITVKAKDTSVKISEQFTFNASVTATTEN